MQIRVQFSNADWADWNITHVVTHGAIRARQCAAQDTGVVGAQRARAVAGLVFRYLRCVSC